MECDAENVNVFVFINIGRHASFEIWKTEKSQSKIQLLAMYNGQSLRKGHVPRKKKLCLQNFRECSEIFTRMMTEYK